MKIPGHLRIEEMTLPPGREWTDNADAWRFLRLSSGAAYWLEPGRPRPFSEGEVLVIAPSVKAVVRASQLNEVVLHGFNFAPAMLCGFFTLAERHYFENGGASSVEPVQFLPSTHPLARRFAELLAHRSTERELTQRAEALGFASSFFSERLSLSQPPSARGVSALHRFQELVCQMPDSQLIVHTPEHLAGLCGCSPRHFNRLFHQYFGESPRARQTELRLLKARELLGATDAKIIQVALDSGYRSLSLFNSLFKRRFGLTPSNWRRRAARAGGKMVCCLLFLLSLWSASVPGCEESQGVRGCSVLNTAASPRPFA